MLDTEFVLSLFGVKWEIWEEILYFCFDLFLFFSPTILSALLPLFSFAVFPFLCVSFVVCLLAASYVRCSGLAENRGLVALV